MSGDAHDHAGGHVADLSYRPLGDPGDWATVAVDTDRWKEAVSRLKERRRRSADWTAMVDHGVLLATAYQSGAIDLLYVADDDLTRRLVSGRADLAAVAVTTSDGVSVNRHVQANVSALGVARNASDETVGSQAWVRQVHEVACRPQITHTVRTDVGDQDHVLAHGDYKHHANHRRRADDTWEATAPVPGLEREMVRLVERLRGDAFLNLHPLAQAAYSHHALSHIQPFADGNGRVARAVASAYLLRAEYVPLLVMTDDAAAYRAALSAADAGAHSVLVDFVDARCRALVEHTADLFAEADSSPEASAALARWARRTNAGRELERFLAEATERALARHRRRTDLRWLSRLDDAVVLTSGPLRIQVALGTTTVVEELLTVDAHSMSAKSEGLLLTARHAQLSEELRSTDLVPMISAEADRRLQGWLDRVVTALALRVAAELN